MSIWDDPSEVTGKSNLESMFFVSSEGLPWHGLGTPVDEALTSTAALAASGQDWTVRLEGIQTVSGLPIEGRRSRAVVREDTNTVLGIVGRRYQPIQNRDAFDFMDTLAAERIIRYHTAGVLGTGERVWILAQLHGDIRIPKTDDIVKKFLLFSNSHNGTSAGRCFWTPVRVVCQNTLNQATRGAQGEGVVIRHTGDLASKVVEAQRILGLAVKLYDDFEGQVIRSAQTRISDAQRKAYFRALYGPGSRARNDEDGLPTEAADAVSTRTRHTLENLERLFTEGPGNDVQEVRGSVWAAYNAVTDHVDHHAPTRIEGDPLKITEMDRRSKKMESTIFGDGARIKAKAWDLARKLIGAPVETN